MPFFKDVAIFPPDPIFSVPLLFKEDTHPHKVNLGIGSYKDEKGASVVLSVIRQAEQLLLQQPLNKDYLPIDGNRDFIEETLKLIFDAQWLTQNRSRLVGAQSIGGAGALRLGGDLLAAHVSKDMCLSAPTWPNHRGIFSEIGFHIADYPYYDENEKIICFEKLYAFLSKQPPASIVLLQASCHNPTGLCPSPEQWLRLSELMRAQRLFPFFDLAYQGFDQSLERDAEVIRTFAKLGHEMMVAYSFSKNMGLYGERVGFIGIVTENADSAKRVKSRLLPLIRHTYSNPPIHGALLATLVLKTPDLFNSWRNELSVMRDRVDGMRQSLISSLAIASSHNFSFLAKQRGLFAYTGLSKDQVFQLREKAGIYLLEDGRMNLAGLTPSNLNYVVESIAASVR